ncbi:MAG: energy-coupling factor ABC transporter ATP-binding protein [Chloroflexi bacterium]|nr:energy-coupling factor ABC transporter ATP-binding protein [Chloroflexota bacterium]
MHPRRLTVVESSGPYLRIEGLTYRYRRATEPALRDINLDLDLGEVLLVAGPSGCGKSTLIRAINGLVPHAYPGEIAGSVKIAGTSTFEMKLRDIARHVGTVLQDPGKQIVGATVEAELAFGPENLGIDRRDIRQRIASVAERAGIESLRGRDTAELSGGEKQLLAMAGILMMQPRLYVVDEPLANLDPATAARLLRLLRSLVDEGNAVVIVEHRVEEALELQPDRVLYLDDGRTRYLGKLKGFLRVADPAAVKLPFEVVLQRARSKAGVEGSNGRPPSSADGEAEPARLDFRAVRAGYGEREVLHGVSARFGRREVVAILGPNGSGKTTLFRTAMKLLPATAGSIHVDGGSIADRTVAQLATVFGYVFQSPSQMLFARTVREELEFGPRNLGRHDFEFERIMADALRRTGLDALEDILERPPLTLSFGQQKRLALAIALALEPPTLILDEPSAGQDHRTAGRFMAEVMAIPGLESIFFVTHDVDLALTHASRILLFRDGKVVADGPPDQVIEDEQRWISCNLRRTSLMGANAQWRSPHGFLDAESLARWIVASGAASGRRGEGGSRFDALPD